ncbi:DUF6415 family natural product biosynthesis protein [Streptomyces sp. NPDC006385]|uniref:DUF6415 family natural product biosynthesis protein n=1 Tax=Streptomyces TaxID=1883 RepID=UPI0019B60BC8|nr:hypothetical protein GCM10018771_61200 [Streptomyces cellulosae]
MTVWPSARSASVATVSPARARHRGGSRTKVAAGRDGAAAAAETVALVLGEDSPLPETDQDVADLVFRLRGHVMQLGAGLPPSHAALLERAQKISGTEIPHGYVPSRVYLRQLAEATRELLEAPRHTGAAAKGDDLARGLSGRFAGLRLPSRATIRITVFVVAMAVLIYAGSGPRP